MNTVKRQQYCDYMIEQARLVIKAAHFKYYNIDYPDSMPIVECQKRNDMAFADCENTVAEMTRVITRLSA